MTSDPRIAELLALYPHDIDADGLAELDAAAASDPGFEAVLEQAALLAAELEHYPLHDGAPLGERASRRLVTRVRAAQAWSTGPAAPTEATTAPGPQASPPDPQAWSTGPAAPTEANVAPPVDLGARRARLRPAFFALAAAVLVGLGFAASRFLAPPADPYGVGFKGDHPSAMEGQLLVHGPHQLEDATEQPIDVPVRFTARLENPGALALLETQAGRTSVVWPLPGHQWVGVLGPNLLRPGGRSADYQPAAPGPATYTLVGRPGPLAVELPLDGTVETFLRQNEGAHALAQITILWQPSGEGSQ